MKKTKLTFANGMTRILFVDTSQLQIGKWLTYPAPVGRYVLGRLEKWEVVE